MFWDSQSQHKQHAVAIKQLGPCIDVKHDVAIIRKSSKECRWQKRTSTASLWDFQPVRLSDKEDHPQIQGRLGQAVLTLPRFVGAEVKISLPPALSINATHSGGLDCRLQLLQLTAEWPATQQQLCHQPVLQPARSAAAGFTLRCAALLLAHALFPDHASRLLARLAVPVALADAAAAVSSAVPSKVKQGVKQRATRVKHKLQRTAGCSAGSGSGVHDVGWLDMSGALLAGAMHTLRSLTGPAAAVAAGGWLWSLLHPSSHTLLSCMVALMAVSAEYQQLGREMAAGKHGTGRAVEGVWHARHKSAAQRLAPFCGDLPRSPPLQHLTSLTHACSIALSLAVEGQHWAGGVVGTEGSCNSTGVQQQQQRRQLPQQQLLLSGSCQVLSNSSSAGKVHSSSAGLSRAQVMELFTGIAGEDDVDGREPPSTTSTAVDREQPTAAAGPADRTDQRLCCNTLDSCPGSQFTSAPGVRQEEVLQRLGPAGSGRCQVEANPETTVAAAAAPAAAHGSAGHCRTDALAFLDSLPLYGQQDHASLVASSSDAAAAKPSFRNRIALCCRGLYLLLVFSPFLLLGLPMLMLAAYLISRAQQQQQQQHKSNSKHTGFIDIANSSSDDNSGVTSDVDVVTVISPLPASSKHSAGLGHSAAAAAAWNQLCHPFTLLQQLLQHLLLLLSMLGAVVDVAVIMLLGGYWSAGQGAWLSAGAWLRCQAWHLLLLSCRRAGAAFIKWGQWSASRRDIFPADFCDALAQLHDKAPVHGFAHTKREVESSFGVPLTQLFDSFDPAPLASGSIAQVHRATCRNSRVKAALTAMRLQQQQQQARLLGGGPGIGAVAVGDDADDSVVEVVVKVAHPNVASQIAQDFQLLSSLSAAAARLPALRGLSLRESVSQFSHTMTAQTDLRVEAIHALRFYNNFQGVRSSVVIPRPLPGLVSPTVLVETYEAGRSVAAYMKEATAINSHIVGLGVDAFLKMLLVDNFVHTDLHPGNILFRAVPTNCKGHKRRKHDEERRQLQHCADQHQPPQLPRQQRWWQIWRRTASRSVNGNTSEDSTGFGRRSNHHSTAAAACDGSSFQVAHQLCKSTQQQIGEQQHRHTGSMAYCDSGKTNNAIPQTADQSFSTDAELLAELYKQQAPGHSSSSSGGAGGGGGGGASAQLVLLDFGLAEELTPEVRHHFISFLMAISAGDGLAAARHLLSWSHSQTCPDRSSFTADVIDLFKQECDIHSAAGIDLDAVMKAVLGLARKHHVSIDSCYASLVISVCVLVGFAKALDPGVNLMDAATPTLLAYAMTGAVVGRLYST